MFFERYVVIPDEKNTSFRRAGKLGQNDVTWGQANTTAE